MGLRVNETTSNAIYESKQYMGSRKENADASENQAANSGVIYEQSTESASKSYIYTREQILSTTSSAANRQFQNNLKTLGFYSGSVATDGNLGSQESMRAIKNFQRVYGLSVNGGSNEETRAKLNEVITFYNNTLKDSELSTVAQRVKGFSDYSESVVKADVARSWTFLRVGMGLTAKQAAGVMGNIIKESGASPTNAQDGMMGVRKLRDTTYSYSATDDVAYGIVQWKSADRKQRLADIANTMGSTTADYNVQFACLRKELETNYADCLQEIKNSDSIEYVAKKFCDKFEGTAWHDDRLDFANTVYDALA